ncbi:MAG: DNA alkylation repair protein [Bifidobacteriaceae bacterium]|jgi:3-methyladenine DNA glycosylase AlkD|nr:DNA alkylation repair protein [Bifidobacteriaceae bacterium]
MFAAVTAQFLAHADAERAAGMSAYMRHQFAFLGIPTPLRRRLSRPLLAAAKTATAVDWDLVQQCWQRAEREFQYLAINYLQTVKDRLTPADLPVLESLVISKAWWDTVDGLDRVIGRVALRYPQANQTLLEYSLSDNIWLRRVAIDHQLDRREQTDTCLLEQIIVNNLGLSEFFINKAIGWSLREYAKTNPSWVLDFLKRHRQRLSALSFREASKHLTLT